jgi:hypothetical protein
MIETEKEMKPYLWAVWQHNRLVGYVQSFSEWDAIRYAHSKYGHGLYVERCLHCVPSNPTDSARVAVVSQNTENRYAS